MDKSNVPNNCKEGGCTMNKIFSSFVVFFFVSMPMMLLALMPKAYAQTAAGNLDVWRGSDADLENVGFKRDTDPKKVAVAVINIMMGFLGLIAVVIVLMGGFKWMTAGGNEDKVAEAKKILGAGVIGLVIIIASYGLAQWMIRTIVGVI